MVGCCHCRSCSLLVPVLFFCLLYESSNAEPLSLKIFVKTGTRFSATDGTVHRALVSTHFIRDYMKRQAEAPETAKIHRQIMSRSRRCSEHPTCHILHRPGHMSTGSVLQVEGHRKYRVDKVNLQQYGTDKQEQVI